MIGRITHSPNNHEGTASCMSGLSNGCPFHLNCQNFWEMLPNPCDFFLTSNKAISSRNETHVRCSSFFFQYFFHFRYKIATRFKIKRLAGHLAILVAKSSHIHVVISQFIRKNNIANSYSWGQSTCRTRIDNGFHFEIIG